MRAVEWNYKCCKPPPLYGIEPIKVIRHKVLKGRTWHRTRVRSKQPTKNQNAQSSREAIQETKKTIFSFQSRVTHYRSDDYNRSEYSNDRKIDKSPIPIFRSKKPHQKINLTKRQKRKFHARTPLHRNQTKSNRTVTAARRVGEWHQQTGCNVYRV